MKRSFVTLAAVSALALAGIASTTSAEARGLGPAIAGGVIAGAAVAGVAGAYAYDAGPGYYGNDSYAYDAGPGYYEPHRYNRNTYGTWDQSAHGGQPTYTRPQ